MNDFDTMDMQERAFELGRQLGKTELNWDYMQALCADIVEEHNNLLLNEDMEDIMEELINL